MSGHEFCRRTLTTGSPRRSAPYVSPAVALAAANAWSAANATAAAGKTTVWLPTAGAVSLTAVGVTQPEPAQVAALNHRTAVTWNTATGAYQGTIPDPTTSQTLLFVGAVGAGNGGWMSITNAGTVNTGSSLFFDLTAGGTVFARRLVADATRLQSTSVPVVALATLTTSTAALYVNSLTPVSVASAAAGFNKTVFTLGALSTALLYAMNGHACAEAAVFARVLTAQEIVQTMESVGSYYGIGIRS